MNDDITKENIGVLEVNHKGARSQWEVTDMTVHPRLETIDFKLESAGRPPITFTSERHGYNDSLNVVRGYLKRAIEAELEARGGQNAQA